jgi:hypothetical protein
MAVPMAVPMAVKRSGRKPRVTSYIEAQQSEEVPQQVEFDEVIE